MDYNATAILAQSFAQMSDDELDSILDDLAAYHPAVGAGYLGQAEVVITLPAQTLAQATQTASAVLNLLHPIGLEVITTESWDRRLGVASMPELLSVSEVAQRKGISRQAVLQRIVSGTLPAHRVGKHWAVPALAVS